MMKNWLKLGFYRGEEGALSVEFAGVFVGFMMVIFLTFDFYSTFALQGRLDRATYSAASVFRERSYFYANNPGHTAEDINATQVAQLEKLIAALLNRPSVELRVEALYIVDSTTNPGELMTSIPNVVSFCGPTGCATNFFNTQTALTNFADLSPYSLLNRWIPLYRVSVCLPNNESLFKKMFNSVSQEKTINDVCSSSIVISRCADNCKG